MAWQQMADAGEGDYAKTATQKGTAVESGLAELWSILSDIDRSVSSMHRRVCGARPEAVEKTGGPIGENYAGRIQGIQQVAQRVAIRLKEIGEQV